MFKYLLGYSPVQNVQSGIDYPATLVTTADHDDRVVPAHSFKFVAQLQAKHTGTNPTLIRIETDAGHGRRHTDQQNHRDKPPTCTDLRCLIWELPHSK